MHRPSLIAAALVIGLIALLSTPPMSTPATPHVLAYPAPASTPTDEPPPGVSTPIFPSPTFDPNETPPPGVSTPTPAPEPIYLPLIIKPDPS